MKKIPTIFLRDMSKRPALIIPIWHPNCTWVLDGEGVATLKYDGTCCLVRGGKLFKRREVKSTDLWPAGFELVDRDTALGRAVASSDKLIGWVPVGDGPEDRWHREAFEGSRFANGTYELVGPKIQGNKSRLSSHCLVKHSDVEQFPDAPRYFEGLRGFLTENVIEGLVWHHTDGRMAKIKRKDFGLAW
ncbi:MAG: DUF5565 family protein [Chitinophagaceae bacterium]